MDVSTVDATDFSVDGVTPVSVTVVDVFEDSQPDPSSSARRPQEVFLTHAGATCPRTARTGTATGLRSC